MSERIEEVRSVNSDGQSATTTSRVVTDQEETGGMASRVIWFIAGVIITLLSFRFVLILLGANPSNQFANFIYSISYPFARPFFGLFSYDLNYGVARVEVSTLVAMAVYAIVAYGLARLLTLGHRRAVV
ncbi:MAG: hypothetical protein ABIV43_04025 [Candidatus Saccharimonadales bacterium]